MADSATGEEAPLPAAIVLRNAVNAEVASRAGEARQIVVARMVIEELNSRADMLAKGLEYRTSAERELRKIKPDIEAFDADGKSVRRDYSKAKAAELKKAKELLAKYDDAIAAALATEPNYDKLKGLPGLAKNGGGSPGGSGPACDPGAGADS